MVYPAISADLYINKTNKNIMATLKTLAPVNFAGNHTEIFNTTLWTKYLAYADSQANNRTLWFFISLMVHGVLLLPVPAVLMYYFNAPVAVLAVTMSCFFANLIANMGGAGIRTTLLCFWGSLLIHMAMIVVFVI